MLLYGKNRIGKTTLACQFPKPLALLSLEHSSSGGARSVQKIEGIQHFTRKELTSVNDIEGLGIEMKESGNCGGYKTVVIDSGSALDELILAEICGWDETAVMLSFGRVSQDQYMERSERMRKVLRPYLELECNVIVIANEKDHNSQEGKRNALLKNQLHLESFFAAAMGGGTTRWVQDACDFITQLYLDKEIKVNKTLIPIPNSKDKKEVIEEIETGKMVRRLRMKLHQNFAGGGRSADPDSIPEYIEASSPQDFYRDFMKVVGGEKVKSGKYD